MLMCPQSAAVRSFVVFMRAMSVFLRMEETAAV